MASEAETLLTTSVVFHAAAKGQAARGGEAEIESESWLCMFSWSWLKRRLPPIFVFLGLGKATRAEAGALSRALGDQTQTQYDEYLRGRPAERREGQPFTLSKGMTPRDSRHR